MRRRDVQVGELYGFRWGTSGNRGKVRVTAPWDGHGFRIELEPGEWYLLGVPKRATERQLVPWDQHVLEQAGILDAERVRREVDALAQMRAVACWDEGRKALAAVGVELVVEEHGRWAVIRLGQPADAMALARRVRP